MDGPRGLLLIGLARPLLIGYLLAQLCVLPGAARWSADPGGLAAASLTPRLPGPARPVPATSNEAELAQAALSAGDAPEATAQLVRAVLVAPNDRTARMALGSQFLAALEHEAAASQFEAVLAQAPDDAVALYELSWALAGALQLDEAIECAKEAARLMPGWSRAHVRLGLILLQAEQETAGQAAIARALECPTVPAEVYYEIGNMQLNQGGYEQAVPFYEAALTQKPKFSFAANNLGNAFKGLKQPLKARRCYEAAINADPANPNPRNALGVLLQETGDVAGALKAYREAERVSPHYVDAHYNVGVLLLGQGKTTEAIQELAAASRLNPYLALAHLRLGEAHHRLGHLKAALESYQRATELDPTLHPQDAEVRRLLGKRRP